MTGLFFYFIKINAFWIKEKKINLEMLRNIWFIFSEINELLGHRRCDHQITYFLDILAHNAGECWRDLGVVHRGK